MSTVDIDLEAIPVGDEPPVVHAYVLPFWMKTPAGSVALCGHVKGKEGGYGHDTIPAGARLCIDCAAAIDGGLA